MPLFPNPTNSPQGGRALLPGFTAEALRSRVQSTLEAPPTTPTITTRAPTPAEEARANLPDAAEKVQATIDRAHRIWAAPTLEEGDRIRREPRTANADADKPAKQEAK